MSELVLADRCTVSVGCLLALDHPGLCELESESGRHTVSGPFNLTPCCSSHVVRGLCCDVDDCGPCCELCPSCPTLAATRAREGNDVIALVAAAQQRVDQLEVTVGSFDNVLPLGPALSELVVAWQGSDDARLRAAGWRLGLLVDHPHQAADLVKVWRELGEI